ncbi:hypothetical protein [Bacillus safensis]|uniref:hypothetical protein n=1 Tax=Bacillus safensis TaxID=561879 RepID=UPI001BA87FCE|nr:hypothetical protein [Bacillus safensis]MBR0638762.1 hypothetical protein [Bacillus safensis]
MNKTNSKTSFDDATNAQLYLQQFGKNMHIAKFSEQEKFKKEIKDDHDRKQIKMLLGRIEDMIHNTKALSYTTAAFYVILAFVLGNQLKYSNDYLLVVIEDIRIQITVVIFVAVLAVGLWGYFTYKDKVELNELSCYKRLLQECLDEIPNRSFK